MIPEFQQLVTRHRLRRGDTAASQPVMASGHPRLDACLPGGGYPAGALTELLYTGSGVGEFSLLLPLLSWLTRTGTHISMVNPPYPPYAPALVRAGVELPRLVVVRPEGRDATQWTIAQMARSGLFGAVLCWAVADYRQLRRLQLAAETGGHCLFLYRSAGAGDQASPAALRLHLEAGPDGLWVSVLKCRGPARARVLCETEQLVPDALSGLSPANDDSEHVVAVPASAVSGYRNGHC